MRTLPLLLLLVAPTFAEITLVGTELTNFESGNVTTHEVTPPAGMADNDVLVVFVSKDDNPSTDCTPDGLILIDSDSWSGGGQMNASLWYKVISDAGSEPSTYTCNHDSEQGNTIATILRGVDNTTPLDVANSIYAGNNDSTPEHPTVTTVTDCAWVYLALGMGTVINSPVTHPGGSTERIDYDSIANSSGEIAQADFVQTSLGATGAQEWTSLDVGVESVLILQAFRPVTADCSAGPTRRLMIMD